MFLFKYLFDGTQEFSMLIAGKNFLLLTQSDMVASSIQKIKNFILLCFYICINRLQFIGSENFQRFVVRKLVTTDLKINGIKQSIRHIKDDVKRILDKLSIGFVS